MASAGSGISRLGLVNRKGKAMLIISCTFLILGAVGLIVVGRSSGVDDQQKEVVELKAQNRKLWLWKEYYRKNLADVPQLWMLVKRTGEDVPDTGSEVREAIQLASSKADDSTNNAPPHTRQE